MKPFNYIFVLLILFAGSRVWAQPDGDQHSRLRRVVEKTYEKSVYARITVNNGTIYINKAKSNQVFNGEFIFTKRPPMVDYEIVGDEGRLSVRVTDKVYKRKESDEENYDIEMDRVYENECYLNFSPGVPLTIKMELGVIKGEVDLGGLELKDVKISTGVSQASIDFNDRNPIRLENLKIENGVGKLKVYRIGNANFSNFDFEGGVGKYVLDFDGEYSRDASVNVEIGMGKLTIYLPRNIGVRIEVDKSFLSSLEIDKVYKEHNFYYNDLWDTDKPKLDLHIDSGVAKIEVEWIE